MPGRADCGTPLLNKLLKVRTAANMIPPKNISESGVTRLLRSATAGWTICGTSWEKDQVVLDCAQPSVTLLVGLVRVGPVTRFKTDILDGLNTAIRSTRPARNTVCS